MAKFSEVFRCAGVDDSRTFLEINALVDDPGALLQASAGGHVEAKIRVVVLDLMKVKLAFGNVVVPADNGHPVFHADKPSDSTGGRSDERYLDSANGHYLFANIKNAMWHNLGHPWSIRDPDKTP
jgi:hypothetical protein